jgi:hypothetical protein
VKLYRAMIVAQDGLPEIGRSPRALGVRLGDQAPNEDVAAVLPGDPVRPGEGGMSVTPNDPRGLVRHRRPLEFGGTGKDPVWEIDSEVLPPELSFRQDKPTHGLIEPSPGTMITLGEFQSLLHSTRRLWKITTPESQENDHD